MSLEFQFVHSLRLAQQAMAASLVTASSVTSSTGLSIATKKPLRATSTFSSTSSNTRRATGDVAPPSAKRQRTEGTHFN